MNPNQLQASDLDALDHILSEFPYLQSARAIRLKALYDSSSFRYNYALKVTAAFTGDRSLLFDFITSDYFQPLPQPAEHKPVLAPLPSEEPLDLHDFAIPDNPFVAVNTDSIETDSSSFEQTSTDESSLADAEIPTEATTLLIEDSAESKDVTEIEPIQLVEDEKLTHQETSLIVANEPIEIPSATVVETEVKASSTSDISEEPALVENSSALENTIDETLDAATQDETVLNGEAETISEIQPISKITGANSITKEETDTVDLAYKEEDLASEAFEYDDVETESEDLSDEEWDAIAEIEVEASGIEEIDPLTTSILSSIREAEQHQRFVSPTAVSKPEIVKNNPTEPESDSIVSTPEESQPETPVIQLASETNEKESSSVESGSKPLAFDASDRFSFSEWLQLSRAQPIVRELEVEVIEIKPKAVEEKVESAVESHQIEEEAIEKSEAVSIEPDESEEISDDTEESPASNLLKNQRLIDQFIENNPKIPPIKPDTPTQPIIALEPVKPADQSMLMTETLARVYLEQKKYQKAIQAYEILILKYPEKSSFFADRILEIKHLKQNNT